MAKFLGDNAAHSGLGRRQVERAFLQDLRDVDPEIGMRVCHIFVESDIKAETLHALLAIFAWQQGVAIPEDDGDRATKFVERLVRQIAKNSSEEDIEQCLFECKQKLLQTFDLPSSLNTLSAYISTMVKGILINKKRERYEASPQLIGDPPYTIPETLIRIQTEIASGSSPWVPHRRRLYDWIKAKKVEAVKTENGKMLITEKGFEQALTMTREHNLRQDFRELADERGLSSDRVIKMIQRNRMPDGTPDWETIYKKVTTASPNWTRKRHKKVPYV
jgi:hypothetical protein